MFWVVGCVENPVYEVDFVISVIIVVGLLFWRCGHSLLFSYLIFSHFWRRILMFMLSGAL